MNELFGTDGIRGKADEYPFDDKSLEKLGVAIAGILKNGEKNIIIGRDTRESGTRILNSLARGLCAGGVKVHDAGVIPTPVISYMMRTVPEYHIGIVISASHNPYDDNGIKLFDSSGRKTDSEVERKIEQEFFALANKDLDCLEKEEMEDICAETEKTYINDLRNVFETEIKNKLEHIVIDCANGATSHIASIILSAYAERVTVIADKPNGININDNCGSTNLKLLKNKVINNKANLGIAFDGDGDRALFVDETGNEIDGDHILALTAEYLISSGELNGKAIVSTVMANFGLEVFLKERNIPFYRTPVGDKYVWQKMYETGSPVGGEQSGHIIFAEHGVTGDGILTALKVIQILSESGKSLSEHAGLLTKYPQVLYNLKVKEKVPLEQIKSFQAEENKILGELNGKGRIVNRYSGTEKLLRVMIEGADIDKINEYAQKLINIANTEINKESDYDR
ncbi:MAG: phosphoglucosamine mutase [Acidobacteria bacterium]|nr:phosphoglucosamine mutase [Acidobacteriota bacterium]